MPPNGQTLNPWQFALGYLVLATAAGVLGSWAWAIVRLSRRQPLLDEPPAPVAPWGARSVVAVVGLYVVVQLGVAWLYVRAMRAGLIGHGAAKSLHDLPAIHKLGMVLAINLAVVALVPVLLRWTCGASPADFGFDRASTLGRDLRRGFVACLLLLPPVYGVFVAAQQVWKPEPHPVQDALLEQAGGANAVLVFLAAVVGAPAAEELLFRGVLLGWLGRAATLATQRGKRPTHPLADEEFDGEAALAVEEPRGERSVWDAPRTPLTDSTVPEVEPGKDRPPMASGLAAWLPNVVVSLLFAGMHAEQWPAPLPLFLLSLALGWLYQRTGRLGAPLALHATFNGFSTVMLLLAVNSGGRPRGVPPAPEPAAARRACPTSGPVLAELTAHDGDLGSPWRTSGRAGVSDGPAAASEAGAGAGSGGTPDLGPRRSHPWTRKARRSSAISSSRPGPSPPRSPARTRSSRRGAT